MITVYLDTSDLSCLAKRDGPGGPDRWAGHRLRLEELLRAGRVLLVVSPLHLYEMSANQRTKVAAAEALETGLPIALIATDPDELFRAELERRKPALEVGPLTPSLLVTIGDRLDAERTGGNAGTGNAGLHAALKGIESLERASRDAESRVPPGVPKGAHRAAQRRSRQLATRIARGSLDMVPPGERERLHEAFGRLPAVGLTPDDVASSMDLDERGCGWIPLVKSSVPAAEAGASVADPARAPAGAMRVAVVLAQRNRAPRASDRIDALHLAYAVQCRMATIDGANMSATTNVRKKIERTTFFGTGNLGPVLDHLEKLVG